MAAAAAAAPAVKIRVSGEVRPLLAIGGYSEDRSLCLLGPSPPPLPEFSIPPAPSYLDVGMVQEPDTGLLPPPCKPASPRCKKFLDRLQLANRSRLNMLLLGTEGLSGWCLQGRGHYQAGPGGLEHLLLLFLTPPFRLASCENDVPCSPAWLPVLERRLCALGCTTAGQVGQAQRHGWAVRLALSALWLRPTATLWAPGLLPLQHNPAPFPQKFANGADLCLSVLGYDPPMAPPGSQRCLKFSSPASSRHRQLKVRGSSLGSSRRRRAPAWILDPAGSGSGSGSGH
ncbi:retbindin [Sorex fumeus]|uniref:retbindin n=1 Tax=Sorex fumeus TaxID=62283 RepID=UPI0024AC8B92|nr:retbindin [Sorex fumeus]